MVSRVEGLAAKRATIVISTLVEGKMARVELVMLRKTLAAMMAEQAGLTAAEMPRVKPSLRVHVMLIALATPALPRVVATRSLKKV
jgi:hypothetical protein